MTYDLHAGFPALTKDRSMDVIFPTKTVTRNTSACAVSSRLKINLNFSPSISGRGVKKLIQDQETEAENQPKKLRKESTLSSLKMDQFEATNYSPIFSTAELASAQLELERAPKALDFDRAKQLYLSTRVLQRKMIQDPNNCKITQRLNMFPWLKEVCIILLF